MQGCQHRKGDRKRRKEKYRTDIYDDDERSPSLILKLPQYRKRFQQFCFQISEGRMADFTGS